MADAGTRTTDAEPPLGHGGEGAPSDTAPPATAAAEPAPATPAEPGPDADADAPTDADVHIDADPGPGPGPGVDAPSPGPPAGTGAAPDAVVPGELEPPGDVGLGGVQAGGDHHAVAEVDPEAYASARAVMPRVIGLTGARSVVAVGCGSGAWIRACRDLGVPEVVGVDGSHVAAEHRRHATEFLERDLARPLDLNRRFNLALCIDVGEHLEPERAPGLVADLVDLAPVVLFSAAVPGQGGDDHRNARWSEYWVALFEAQGWTCRDGVRPWVRTNQDVAWWHRQNLYLAVAPAADTAYSSFPRLDGARPADPVDYVRRPPGDVMVPPPPPLPEPERTPDPAPVPPEPGAGAAAPDPPDGAWADGERREPDGGPTAGDPAEPGASAAGPPAEPHTGLDRGTDPRAREDRSLLPGPDEHPRPPGWDALRRVAGRVRRRSGG